MRFVATHDIQRIPIEKLLHTVRVPHVGGEAHSRWHVRVVRREGQFRLEKSTVAEERNENSVADTNKTKALVRDLLL